MKKFTVMKVYVTLDCVKLNQFEKLVLTCLRGVLCEHDHLLPTTDKEIWVSKADKQVFFKVKSGWIGLFEDLKYTVSPFSHDVPMFGKMVDGDLVIYFQRFELERQKVNLNFTSAKFI